MQWDHEEGLSYLSPTGRRSTYGGKLVENVTQAVARDVMSHALLNVEAAGLRPVLTVHDEIICETDELEAVERLMLDTPPWAKGLPIAVEGRVDRRYGK